MNDNVQDANNDGISIIDIIFLLLNRKMIIFWIVTVVVCVGLLYALSIKRVYQAEIIVSPPSFEHVNSSRLAINSDSIFDSFLQIVESRKLKKEFFENNNILDVYLKKSDDTPSIKDINKAFESFSKSIKVDINKKSNFTKVTLESIDKNKLSEELADVFIYAFLIAEKHDLDIKEIILEKLALNAKKYPINKSLGKADKYNEL